LKPLEMLLEIKEVWAAKVTKFEKQWHTMLRLMCCLDILIFQKAESKIILESIFHTYFEKRFLNHTSQ
jgi:hypothetical protein